MRFQELLDREMERLGRTNAELAAASGLGKSTLSRYRRGEREPRWGSPQLWQLAKGLTCRQDFGKIVVEHIALQIDIEEARPCNLSVVQPAVIPVLQTLGNGLGNLPGRLVEHSGGLHGNVGGKVAVLLLGGHLQIDFRQLAFRQGAISDGLLGSLSDSFTQEILDFQNKSP